MAWELNGNSGIKPNTNYLGTRDQRPLAVRTSNAERLRVTPEGNVGVGTNNPTTRLHVHLGRLRVSESDGAQTSGVLELANPAKTNFVFTDGPTGHLHLRTDSATHHVVLQTGGAQGNVGIGTTPSAKLHVAGGLWNPTDTEGDFKIGDATYRLKIGVATGGGGAGDVRIRAHGGTNRLMLGSGTVDTLFVAGDRVGIGTMAPASKLDVTGGDIRLEGGRTFYSPGRLHVHGEELLYLLNKAGVVVGQEWGGNGNLSVQGNVTVGAGRNGSLRTRHVDGKHWENDSDAGLHLNFWSGQNVYVGNPNPGGTPASLVVSGDVLLSGADCAEDFDVTGAEEIEPGTVLVIDEDGVLRESSDAYDSRVAGVVSGGGEYRAGLILDKQEGQEDRRPVALMGKVSCKVDARYSPIEVGDLLTTSPTPGHAMKADAPGRSSGAVLGKALRRFTEGQGLLPVLVSLQ